MSIFVKPKLKALKECLGKKDWPGVEKNARCAPSSPLQLMKLTPSPQQGGARL